MRTLWVDPRHGAAGDMLLAALLDAGADLGAVRAALAALPVEAVTVSVDQVRRFGFRAALVSVTAPRSDVHRSPATLVDLVTRAALPEPVRRFAAAVFRRLGEAEARVHGVALAEVHLHEVGALDAVADVVGCAVALHDLGLLDATERVVGPVGVGYGTVRTAHGALPVPAPAVLEILAGAGAPIAAHPAEMELCTPTGAALLATLATGWGPPPGCTPQAVGVGAGHADPRSHPNVVRVLVGEAAGGPPDWTTATLYRVDTTIDDMDPRLWPELLDALRDAGAADAWCTPATMRKGRPGQVLSVLASATELDLVCRIVFERTTTLGVRVSAVQRLSLRREAVEVPVGDAVVQVKRGYLGDRLVTVQPEYDDVLAAAHRTGLALPQLLALVRRTAERQAATGQRRT
ncbi:MAG TPA: nickel pincer cofactor biosynthesis protein LarC [Micromonosporaceae bacterium]|nr:nickel pincer cofactor biosynthesis protein LarC [Micromonosporaceae bacterium]